VPHGAARVLVIIAGVLFGTPAFPQTPPDPPGPYVIDVRGAMSGLPGTGFFPPIPADTFVPSRGFGADVGGHIYWRSLGAARLGFGLNVVWVRGTASTVPTTPATPTPPSTTTPPTVAPVLPDVETSFVTVAPQISFNFGTAEGWSHLSAGLGRGWIDTRATSPATASQAASLDLTRRSGGVRSLNFGGGARWFLRGRLAVGFDVRFHRLAAGSGDATNPGTPGAMFLAATIGLSLR
jgi:hypothetical protein